jgi:small-conductance mechanosensitive channel
MEANLQDGQILDLIRFGRIPYAILILLATVVLVRVLNGFIARLGDRFADKRLVIQQAGSFLRFLIYIVGGFVAAATVVTLRKEVLLALGGTVAVSLGFALKDVFASLAAGVIILVDKPFQVGDRVTFDQYYGEIKEIGLRSVRLLTLDDTTVTIPNNKFLTDVVASGNDGAVEMMIQMDFFIGADQDVAEAKKIVEEALTTSRYVHLGFHWMVLVSQVIRETFVAVRIRAKAYVLDVKFEKAFETDVTERVLQAFREKRIQPPAVLHREAGRSDG